MVRVAIVGCGLIGHKRARSVCALGDLVAVADVDRSRAERLAAVHAGCVASADWQAVVTRQDVDAVIVSTTNDSLAAITLAAIRNGKHVLVEKPAARSPAELEPVLREARSAGVCIRVGFNHRFHPAFQAARMLADSGTLGPLLYLRARYGHGGRVGYEREWRANPALSGGGELLDQGVHLIDLSRWFLGDFTDVRGLVHTYFWKMPVEDNAFLTLSTSGGELAWLHASCTEWKNLFSFEIFGQNGKLQIDGLGGSYGVERLTHYKMKPAMGPPETTIWEYPGEDRSWHEELADFVRGIECGSQTGAGLEDAMAALEVVDEVYRQAGRAPAVPGEERQVA
jgi:predicted dehydrogenase